MPGIPSWQGQVVWETRTPDGCLLASGSGHNLLLDQGRSAYVGYLRFEAGGPPPPSWLHLGTGTAVPQAADTALQLFVTSLSASAVAVLGNFTARQRFQLGATQMTSLITELLLATSAGGQISAGQPVPVTAYAKVTLSANHASGSTLTFSWLEALRT